MRITTIIYYLEKKIALLQTAVQALKRAEDLDKTLINLFSQEIKLDASLVKRSKSMKRAWERRKRDGEI